MTKKNNHQAEGKCRICKRILVGESKSGLCTDCLNKYGTGATVFGAGALILVGQKLLKNSGKIFKGAVGLIKNIRM